MEGPQIQETDSGYRSRLGSRVELTLPSGGDPIWSQSLGAAEDQCLRRRRDYFVNYRLTLPSQLSPGPYLLRLTQTDLLTGRSVASSLDVTLSR
jgi:hypothetical protein